MTPEQFRRLEALYDAAAEMDSDGRRRFIAYLEELERVVRDALPKAESVPARSKQLPPGWQPA